MVRMQPDQLARLDAWIAARDPSLSRPAAIRAIVNAHTKGLATDGLSTERVD